MNKLDLKSRDFEQSKYQLKNYLKSANAAQVKLQKVDSTTGPFGWFDHSVTGAELNQVTTQIQEQFIKSNELNRNFIKEMEAVYTALSALDKDYIQAIQKTFNNAQLAFDESQIAFKKAVDAFDKAEIANVGVGRSVRQHEGILELLKIFKKDIEKIKYLQNVDEMWYGLASINKSIEISGAVLEEHSKVLDGMSFAIEKYGKNSELKIGSVQCSIDNIVMVSQEQDQKINDLDFNLSILQEYNQSNDEILKGIELSIADNQKILSNHYNTLQCFQITNSNLERLKHLYDIDILWEKSEEYNKNFKTQDKLIHVALNFKDELSKLQNLHNIDQIWFDHQKMKNELLVIQDKIDTSKKDLISHSNKYQNTISKMNLKIKIAYFLAGSSLILTAINFYLNFFKVLP